MASSQAPSGAGYTLIQISNQPYGRNSESVNGVVEDERDDYDRQIEEYIAHGAASAFIAPALHFYRTRKRDNRRAKLES